MGEADDKGSEVFLRGRKRIVWAVKFFFRGSKLMIWASRNVMEKVIKGKEGERQACCR